MRRCIAGTHMCSDCNAFALKHSRICRVHRDVLFETFRQFGSLGATGIQLVGALASIELEALLINEPNIDMHKNVILQFFNYND